MPVQVLMPQLGESVVEGTITRWLKAVGERVEEFEPLVEVNTDKVDTEVPSPAAGILLEIRIAAGTVAQAGAVLAVIGQAGEAGASHAGFPGGTALSRPAEPEEAPPLEGHPGRSERGFISPVVARLAQEHHLDLSRVPGSGLGGRVTKKDVLAYLEAAGADRPASQVPMAPRPVPVAAPVPAPVLSPTPAVPLPGSVSEDELLPFTPLRRSIAEHMVLSKQTSPHVTTIMEVDLSRVVAHRQANKADFSRQGVNLTYMPYLVAATVVGLRAYPLVNASWSEAGIVVHRGIHIGMATSLGEAGLIVPVIKQADTLSLLGLARMVNDLATRARARQLKPDEVRGGTFTITNHGMNGSLFASPIINQPQCAILGVGAIQKRVVVVSGPGDTGDMLAIRPMAYLSLTFDHRILDGAIADYFLSKVVESLQRESW